MNGVGACPAWWLLLATCHTSGEEAEAEMLARARRGDPSALEEIVRRHQTRLFNLAYRMLRNREEAEDVTQDTFLKAFESLSTLREATALRAWLCRIAANLCLARLRSPAYRREQAAALLPAPISDDATSAQAELTYLVQEALAQLPAHYRLALTTCYLEGRSYQEAAHLLGVGARTLKTRVHRARRELRARLAPILAERTP